MKKLFFKRALALIMAVSIVMLGSMCVNAVELDTVALESQQNVCVLDETIEISDNEVYFCTYNITENNKWGIEYRFDDENLDNIAVWAKDCVEEPYRMETVADLEYKLYQKSVYNASGYIRYTYNNTGGTYRKVRFKLSEDKYFNADGSCTMYDHNYYFGDEEHEGENLYSAGLIVVSGACVNFVAPDEDGFVEFYVSTDIGVTARFSTSFHRKVHTESSVITGGGGGVNGSSIKQFTKGAVEGRSFIYISDATLIQKYASHTQELDELQEYRADVDCDGNVTVLDATKIQRYLAKTDN